MLPGDSIEDHRTRLSETLRISIRIVSRTSSHPFLQIKMIVSRTLIRALALSSLLVAWMPREYATAQKRLTVRHVPTGPIIDGLVDEVWLTADSTGDFFQLAPYYAAAPSRRTVARVLTTDDALYCLMTCYEDPVRIQATRGMHDQVTGDVVSIMLDTYGDRKTAYKFGVAASGVRNDCRLLDDGRNRDYTWDGVWFADAKEYSWGYAVEMRIPYRSIQYDSNLRSWGLDFDRWIAMQSEDLYWNEYPENEGQRISRFGSLDFESFYPDVRGLSLEIYPVGLIRTEYLRPGIYDVTPTAGLDVFYNPSPMLTFSGTVNPDFAQIEADPYDFNITRYESYFEERRPFFTEGNEIFMASGKQRNMGFYQPLELFYSRRIGRKLPDGQEIPLIAGGKAFGRLDDWEYGGFVAQTAALDYLDEDSLAEREKRASFANARLTHKFGDNNTAGLLFVGKFGDNEANGVMDLDGAWRASDWQLAWQVARSFRNSDGDFAASAGFTQVGEHWVTLVRGRHVGESFDVDDVGYVPWKGTAAAAAIAGPRWYIEEGAVRDVFFYGGGLLNYEKEDSYTDIGFALGHNIQFRDNWGGEINIVVARAKDEDIEYDSYEISSSVWLSMNPAWNLMLSGGYTHTYNFSRGWLAHYIFSSTEAEWRTTDILTVGGLLNTHIEGRPGGGTEDVTLVARPFLSLTPWNNFGFRVYVDNVYTRSSNRLERVILGVLFSWNFSPKSWVYFAYDEFQERMDTVVASGVSQAAMQVRDRKGVLKLRYLYYF